MRSVKNLRNESGGFFMVFIFGVKLRFVNFNPLLFLIALKNLFA